MDFDFNHPHCLTYRQLDVAWPLRLLHIDSMTSVERTGINTYDKTNAPQYAIITYTWGRYKAPVGSPALPVKGTTWKIPPVKDSCFSVKSFKRAIKHIRGRYEWLWVDVACIDQENESVKMSEVARQVGIFHGAAEAYAWLHSLKTTNTSKYMAVLAEVDSFDLLGEDHIWNHATEEQRLKLSLDFYRARLDVIRSALEFIFVDPWFTSLWTLQESILRRDARLLSAEGEPIHYKDKESGSRMRDCTIASLNGWCESIWKDLRYYSNANKLSARDQPKATAIITLIERAGFNFTAAVNPNVQYGAARFRETDYPLDRIYGILGIYRSVIPDTYQLPVPSKTTPDALELAFASALNEACPWLAQCFVHLAQPKRGRSWCIAQASMVPTPFEDFNSKWSMNVESRLIPGNSGHAIAQGKACPLKVLWAYWSRMREVGLMSGITKFPYRFAVAFDEGVSALLGPSHSQRRPDPIVEWVDRSSQDVRDEFNATGQLLAKYPLQDLYVLHMVQENANSNNRHADREHQKLYPKIWCMNNGSGTHPPQSVVDTILVEQDVTWGLQWEMTSIWDGDRKAFGVILLRDNAHVWKRIGICTWIEMPHTGHSLRHWTCEVH